MKETIRLILRENFQGRKKTIDVIRKMDTPKNNRVFGKMYMLFLKQYWEEHIAPAFGENPTKEELFSGLETTFVKKRLINQVSDAIAIRRYGRLISTFFLAKFLINNGEDIFDYGELHFWLGGVNSGLKYGDNVEYLKLLGIFDYSVDKYVNFEDITFDGNKIYLTLENSWVDFAGIFYETRQFETPAIRSVLSPINDDTSNVYILYYYDKETLMDMLDSDSLKRVVKKFINDVDYVEGIGFREEFNHYGYDIVEDDKIDIKKHADTILSMGDPYTFLVLINNSHDISGKSDLKNYKKWLLSGVFTKGFNRFLKTLFKPKFIEDIIFLLNPVDFKIISQGNENEKVILDITNSYDDLVNTYINEHAEFPDEYKKYSEMVKDFTVFETGKYDRFEVPDINDIPDEKVKRYINQYIKLNVN